MFPFWIPGRRLLNESLSNRHPFEDLALNIRHETYLPLGHGFHLGDPLTSRQSIDLFSIAK